MWKARSGQPTRIASGYNWVSRADIAGDGTVIDTYASGGPRTLWYEDGTASDLDVGNGSGERISENGVGVVSGDSAYTVTGPTTLQELSPATAGWATYPVGISQNGSVVTGQTWDPVSGSSSTARGIVWNDGTPKNLAQPAGATQTSLLGANDAGTVVGWSSMGSNSRAVSYNASGNPTLLPNPSGYSSAYARAINNAGTVVGYAGDSAGTEAVVWLDGTAHKLNDLTTQLVGFSLENALDVNASGQIVGIAELTDGSKRGYIATPTTPSTIYTAPGYHEYNNRLWRTGCTPYSQTTRCTTEIIATNVEFNNGKYERVTGWTFNNLTYTPSAESLWKNNPLATTGEWTSNGRQWRTECKTPQTGSNACRSYIFGTVVAATAKPGGGYTYTATNKWVFNNIVHFN